MKTETMTPQWVVENFLPNYHNRLNSYKLNVPRPQIIRSKEEYFTDEYFHEALSELLKAQREVCAKIYNERTGDCDLWVLAAIDNAPIPEPKNRK